jgi:hypothetical protein
MGAVDKAGGGGEGVRRVGAAVRMDFLGRLR